MSLLAASLTAGGLLMAAGDPITTEVAIKQGFVETGPQQRSLRYGANVFLTGSVLLVARELDKQGHHGWANTTRGSLVVGWGACVVRNILTMRRGIGKP